MEGYEFYIAYTEFCIQYHLNVCPVLTSTQKLLKNTEINLCVCVGGGGGMYVGCVCVSSVQSYVSLFTFVSGHTRNSIYFSKKMMYSFTDELRKKVTQA